MRKILLLGEFSGFYLNLKKGLTELGMDVTLAANGDGWKKIPGADIPLYNTEYKNKVQKVYNRLLAPLFDKEKFYGYDVVQMIHEDVFRPYINSNMIKSIKEHNGKLFVNVCGNCNSLYLAWKNGLLDYYTFNDNEEKYADYIGSSLRCKKMQETEKYVDSIADGLIPMAYEYAQGVRHLPNFKRTVQIPFDASAVEYNENKVGDKVVFFHGLLREKDKGTAYIREAFNIIRDKYPNDVECIMDGNLPLKEYLEVLSKTNVLVDMCKEHCWGYNSCYGLAQGKVVMAGATENTLKEFGIDYTPVHHIGPDTKMIVEKMEHILENRHKIPEWGAEGRKFVEEFHDAKKIAKEYVKIWAE